MWENNRFTVTVLNFFRYSRVIAGFSKVGSGARCLRQLRNCKIFQNWCSRFDWNHRDTLEICNSCTSLSEELTENETWSKKLTESFSCLASTQLTFQFEWPWQGTCRIQIESANNIGIWNEHEVITWCVPSPYVLVHSNRMEFIPSRLAEALSRLTFSVRRTSCPDEWLSMSRGFRIICPFELCCTHSACTWHSDVKCNEPESSAPLVREYPQPLTSKSTLSNTCSSWSSANVIG
jgi:hypothetical protein